MILSQELVTDFAITSRRISMKYTLTILILAALLPLTANAKDKCDAQAEAEQNRITREFSSQAPSKNDQQAYLAWSKNLNAALAAAAQRHEDCVRSARAASRPANTAKMDECIAEANRHYHEIEAKYRGRTLTVEEQAAHRAEEEKLLEERMACNKLAGR